MLPSTVAGMHVSPQEVFAIVILCIVKAEHCRFRGVTVDDPLSCLVSLFFFGNRHGPFGVCLPGVFFIDPQPS